MKFVDLQRQRQRLGSDLDSAIKRVVDNCDFIGGQSVSALEERLSACVNRKHVITVGNGTDALQLSLMALGVGPGDFVITTSFSFFATAEAISAVGATPVFVDVDYDTFNVSPDSLRELLQNWRFDDLPKAALVVDLFGAVADYKSIFEVLSGNKIPVIEDGAQSFGASWNGARAGSFGSLSTTSFFPSKPLGCFGDGGAVFTDSDEMENTLRSLRCHGMGKNKYENVRIGTNSRLDTIQATILLEKLKIFNDEIDARNRIATEYTNRLDNAVSPPALRDGEVSAWANYTIRVPNRDKLGQELAKLGVPTMVYYATPLHKQPVYLDNQNYVSLANSERLANEVLSIPIHPYLSDEEVSTVINSINSLVKKL